MGRSARYSSLPIRACCKVSSWRCFSSSPDASPPSHMKPKGLGLSSRADFSGSGTPTLFFVVVLGPITEYYVAHSWRTKQSFAHEMVLYFLRGRFLSGTGPMWFCAALLLFSGIYALYETSGAFRRLASAPAGAKLQPSGVMLTIAAMAISTFLVRIVEPASTIGVQHAAGRFSVLYHHVWPWRCGRKGGLD